MGGWGRPGPGRAVPVTLEGCVRGGRGAKSPREGRAGVGCTSDGRKCVGGPVILMATLLAPSGDIHACMREHALEVHPPLFRPHMARF